MAYQNILSELKQHILYVTVNRPQKLNALNKETLAELADAIGFAAENVEVRGVLLTGAGEKAFVAGADIAEFAEYTPAQGEALAREGQKNLFNAIENCPKPVIAAINGFALGGGLELAMACHMRIASDNSKLGLPEVSLGLVPGYGGTQRLTLLVGKGRAMELITTGDMISAEKAERFGLVNYVVPQMDLIATAEQILNKVITRAPLAVAGAIAAINAADRYDINGFETEIGIFGRCFGTMDFKEGTAAFINKRTPKFKGS
jgi:enoyl-CoA hydratase